MIFTNRLTFALFVLPLAVVGCTEDDSLPPASDAAAETAAVDTGSADTASPDTSNGDTGTTVDGSDASMPAFTEVAAFNATAFQLPEGLTVHKGAAYVGLAPLGQIKKITPAGVVTDYATVPPGTTNGYTLGLAFDSADNLYVLQTKNSPTAPVLPGVYKIPPAGGAATTPFAFDPKMNFPNGIAIAPNGNLLVTDSGAGVIFSVTPAGAVTTWKSDPELTATPACPGPLPFPIGANGIVVTPTDVFVANTAKGSILRIAVGSGGAAGAVTTLIKDCRYFGLDGIARDRDGSIWATINGTPGQLIRVTMERAVSVIANARPLDGPASVAFADAWSGQRVALITNSAFFSGGDAGPQTPSLLKYGPLP